MDFLKANIWRGLAAAFSLATAIGVFGTILAVENEGQVNVFLGTLPSTKPTQGSNVYYPSAFKTVEEMREEEKKVEIQTSQEGSVLLENRNNALPFSSNSRITLFGRTSANPIYRGGSGGSATGTEAVSLYDGLKNNGVAINDTIFNALKSSDVTRSRGFIGEVGGDFYKPYQNSFQDDFNDAAVVVLGRYSGEQQDSAAGGDANADIETDSNGDPIDTQGVAMLSLHKEERDTLQFIKDSGKFKRTIVVLNTASTMDIGELESYGVDAVLWSGITGTWGFQGVADILVGKASPSGRTVDTYATKSLSSPAMRNFGGFTWSNISESGQNKYLVYAEGIYVGYKYYETRYQDQILGINNATSQAGAYASQNGWNYSDEMVHSFGSGLSYVGFSQNLDSLEWDRENKKVIANITVTSLGTKDGNSYEGKAKDVVELYAQVPYQKGQAEKSAIQLIGYAKTKELAKGESETVKIEADDYLFATYDNKAKNGADETKTGAYVFDPGDYYFSIGNNSHDALNNILSKKGATGLIDEKGNAVLGDSNKVEQVTLDELDNTTHAKSSTGEIVSNQFDDIDMNHYSKDAVTYLTRSDWNTYPKRIEDLTATDEIKTILKGNFYKKPSDAPNISSFKHSKEVTKKVVEMRDVPYEDEASWNAFIDQLTPTDLAKIPGEKFGNPSFTEIGMPQTSSADGPDGIQANAGYPHVAESVAASTYNDELLKLRGEFMAEDGIWSGQSGVYGFGANMHRTPYGGRNFEYYSEDANLSYLMGAVQTKAAQDKGLITYVKHFTANDQEVWRNGNSTLMTEQTFREFSLRGFEGSFVKGGSLGTMTSNTRTGLYTTSMNKAVMTQVLRKEWGFKGLAMTDSSKGSRYYIYTNESFAAGIDQFNNDEDRGGEMKNLLIKDRDGFMWQRAREIAKHFFYAYSHSFAMNGLSKDSVIQDYVPWWKTSLYALDGVFGAVATISLGLWITSIVVKGKKRN